MHTPRPYKPVNTIRIVTAASLFDGHDAAINVMRRILQSTGCEVIHLGHNRSVAEVVTCAIQEDVQAIAMTSYQGGHIEYFKYMHDLLNEGGAGHIKIFGGGGGTILLSEIQELQAYGIARIYSPDDGRSMGLQGMINDVVSSVDYPAPFTIQNDSLELLIRQHDPLAIAQAITMVEREGKDRLAFIRGSKRSPVLGITGTGGAGKSTLTDEIIRRFLIDQKERSVAVISVDPSKRKTGGALLGDRIRMNAVDDRRVYMRSFATREANVTVNRNVADAIDILSFAGYDLIIVETAGIGQSDSQITELADVSMYVMTPEYGAASQLEKIDMIDFADLVVLNKADKRGAEDAMRDVRKQYQRSRQLFDQKPEMMPVFGTIASQFNDPGTNTLYTKVLEMIINKLNLEWMTQYMVSEEMSEKVFIIPPDRNRYLAEIVETNRQFDDHVAQQADVARKLWQIKSVIHQLNSSK
ncbi:MAG: cobalamin B12-binding domain-containing protein [Ignavibacteria bacterium]|nr:cobalamin B12-binding domain-containing protein [Ignavibacteria bacterium]